MVICRVSSSREEPPTPQRGETPRPGDPALSGESPRESPEPPPGLAQEPRAGTHRGRRQEGGTARAGRTRPGEAERELGCALQARSVQGPQASSAAHGEKKEGVNAGSWELVTTKKPTGKGGGDDCPAVTSAGAGSP